MTTACYSGTPLAKKLGIKPDQIVTTVDAPAGFEALLEPLPDGVRVSASIARVHGTHAMLIAFYTEAAELAKTFVERAHRVVADGSFSIAWPKRSSGVASDITEEMLPVVGLPCGMVDSNVCAIDETLSGLHFVVRKEHRTTWPDPVLA